MAGKQQEEHCGGCSDREVPFEQSFPGVAVDEAQDLLKARGTLLVAVASFRRVISRNAPSPAKKDTLASP
jgi:hypothetical protein